MKIALVHDYLTQDGGAERVLLAFHELFPQAPIYTLFHDPERTNEGFANATILPSKLNRIPLAPKHYQWYLPFMPHAVDMIDLREYDVVLSNSSTFAKGAIASTHGVHLSYCHTPTRFLWEERADYIDDLPHAFFLKAAVRPMMHQLRVWDTLAAARPDYLFTNSRVSQARIKRYYRRDAQIIHPPVDVDTFSIGKTSEFWLAGGRLVPYKRFDLIVQACTKLGVPLVIFGDGPEFSRLRKMAGKHIRFTGRISDEEKRALYANSIGFLHPQLEDFGITPIEAMASGKPVIAYGRGGAKETMIDGVTGRFITHQRWQDLAEAIRTFDASRYNAAAIRAHAETFSKPRFMQDMRHAIDAAIQTYGMAH